MENLTTNANTLYVNASKSVVTAPINDKAAKKAADKAAKDAQPKPDATVVSTVFTWKVKGESKESKVITIDYNAFPQSLGRVLNELPISCTFSFLGYSFVIPALTANNSNPERAAAIFKQVVKHFFPASDERTVAIDADSKKGMVLLSMKKAGFRFTTLCKAEVGKAVDFWLNNKRAKISLAIKSVREQNKEMIEQTKEMKAIGKKLDASYLSWVTGYEQKKLENGKLKDA